MTTAAYYRFESKVVTRSKGQSSVAAAAYNSGEKLKDERTGELHDYTRKRCIYGTEILAPANAPEWVFDRKQLWNGVEASENRKDSQVARQFIICFPTCLTHEEKQAVARSFLHKECVARGMIADIAYHDFQGKDSNNPHAHVLLTMRLLTRDGFGSKNRDWNRRELLQDWREKWAVHLNYHLERGGHQFRVDHRSYQERGIDLVPQVHEGKAVTGIRDAIAKGKRTQTTSLIDYNNGLKQLQAEIILEEQELKQLRFVLEQDNKPPASPSAMQHTATEAARLSPPKPEPSPRIDPAQVTASIMDLHRQSREQFQSALGEIAATASAAEPPHLDSKRSHTENKPAPSTDKQQNNKVSDRSPPDKERKREPDDPTWQAVNRQLVAMGGDGNFEVGIFDRDAGKMRERLWSRDQICRIDPTTGQSPIIQYLKAENVAGKDIYVRPARLKNERSQGIILVDDIDEVTVEDLQLQGLHPCVYVETSHRNGQAWVNVGQSLSHEEATQVAKVLAKEAGADAASASYQHYGRLAGFTNRKDEHFNDRRGMYPWVKVLQDDPGRVAASADRILALARHQLEVIRREKEAARRHQAEINRERATADELDRAAASFLRLRSMSERKHGLTDSSRLDWVALKQLAKRGCKLEALEHALWHSPDVEKRKKGHEEDYVRRTAQNVAKDADVLAALHRRQQRQVNEKTQQKSPPLDDRKRIDQFQQFKDRERGSRASSSAKEQVKRPGGEKAKPSPPPGNGNKHIRKDDIPLYAMGKLDRDAVAWIIDQTMKSDPAQKQFRKAAWALGEDTSRWKDRCRAEYLKELARCMQVKGALAYTPHTDAEIGLKLRMAGFSKNQIARILTTESPFVQHMDAKQRNSYLANGIAPLLNHPRNFRMVSEFQAMRHSQAQQLPEAQRDAYLKKRCLEELKLSTTKERWEQQRGHHHDDRHPERER